MSKEKINTAIAYPLQIPPFCQEKEVDEQVAKAKFKSWEKEREFDKRVNKIKENFFFDSQYDLKKKMMSAFTCYQVVRRLEFGRLKNSSFKRRLKKIKKGTKKYLDVAALFFLDNKLFKRKYYKIKKEIIQFYNVLKLMEGRISREISNINLNYKLPGWPNRLSYLNKIIEEFLKIVKYGEIVKPSIYLEDCCKEFSEAIDIAKELYLRVAEVIKVKIKSENGRDADVALNQIICNLIEIFEEGTGKKASVAFHPVNYIYYGDFLKFIVDCLNFLGIKANGDKFAKRCSRVIAKYHNSNKPYAPTHMPVEFLLSYYVENLYIQNFQMILNPILGINSCIDRT